MQTDESQYENSSIENPLPPPAPKLRCMPNPLCHIFSQNDMESMFLMQKLPKPKNQM